MTDKIMYWASVFFSALALLLLVANTALFKGNRNLQDEIGQRQAVINNAQNLTPLNQNLAQALAESAIKNDDKKISDLLASQGITIRKPEKGKDAKKTEKPADE